MGATEKPNRSKELQLRVLGDIGINELISAKKKVYQNSSIVGLKIENGVSALIYDKATEKALERIDYEISILIEKLIQG